MEETEMPSDSSGLRIRHLHSPALFIARELTAIILREGEIGGTAETLASNSPNSLFSGTRLPLTCAGTHSCSDWHDALDLSSSHPALRLKGHSRFNGRRPSESLEPSIIFYSE
jgi:hypothetical protein